MVNPETVRRVAAARLWSRAGAFHRAVERLVKWPNEYQYRAARRRWRETNRALRAYRDAGGYPETQTYAMYHLANARSLMAEIHDHRLEGGLKELER